MHYAHVDQGKSTSIVTVGLNNEDALIVEPFSNRAEGLFPLP